MCGIVGIIDTQNVNHQIYDSLISIQHRGQDAVGISTYNGQFHLKKGLGLVRDVFDERNMARLQGNIGLGQVRYPTVAGSQKSRIEDVQPFYVNSPYGITLVHNGNIFNFSELKNDLFVRDNRHINSSCDTETLINVLAFELSKEENNGGDFSDKFFNSLKRVFLKLKGSYSVVGVIAGKGMFAFRDPNGIKPLVLGEHNNSYIVASENVMFSSLGYKFIRDLEPGEAVFIDNKLNLTSRIIDKKGYHPCIFEYVYFARPDAFLDKISVYKSRLRMGQFLAKKILAMQPKLDIDSVVPIPSTATTTAMALAFDIGVKYREGLFKNQFVGRTFIMPGQNKRNESIRYKLSPINLEIKNKNILLVDDSIVRGNTSKQIINLVKRAGAKKVYLASASPPIRYPCLYGIDMPTKKEFIANNLEIEEIKSFFGVDELIYQDLDDLVECVVHHDNPELTKPCTACFSGDYITKDIDENILKKAEEERLSLLEQDEEHALQGKLI